MDDFQGKIEAQGDYDTIMKSGVDLTELMEKNEQDDEENSSSDLEDPIKLDEENVDSMKTSKNSNIPGNEVTENSKDLEYNPKEESNFLKELESSSKGKVKGSLLLSYFKFAKRPCTLVFLIVSFMLAQALASCADVWVSFWYVF